MTTNPIPPAKTKAEALEKLNEIRSVLDAATDKIDYALLVVDIVTDLIRNLPEEKQT